jgi:glutathione S-transferase
VNPSALVPTLIPIKEDGEADEERAVFESLVTMEYIDEVSGAQGKDRLVAEDPFLAARSRIWADKVNRDCCSPYYGVLVRKDKEEQRDHFEKLVQGLTKFSTQLEATSGDLFLPDNQLSIVDLALLPWACRFYVFEKYRGEDFKIPQDPALDAYHRWYEHVTSMDSVKRTLPPKDDYLEHIGKYADGSARSKVANAVRRGVSAHEFDDDVDDYQGSEKDV